MPRPSWSRRAGLVYEHLGVRGLVHAGANRIAIATSRAVGRRFVERRVRGSRMLLDVDDPGISRTLLLFGSREEDMFRMLAGAVRAGSTVLDIGANIGYYPLIESRLVGPAGRVVAIEPSPSNLELCRRNLALNGVENVELLAGAVSDREGTQTFHLSEASNLNTFHPEAASPDHALAATVDVETFTLPGLVRRHGAPDLVRMDIEGHEVEVLETLVPAVEAGTMAPHVCFEVHPRRYATTPRMRDVLRELARAGYRAEVVSSSNPEGTATVTALGYAPYDTMSTDFTSRALFRDVAMAHLEDLLCRTGGVRTVLLSPR